MEKLANRKKPLTDAKWKDIIEHKIGIDFPYIWNPITKHFHRYYGDNLALTNNTVILFFPHKRIALRLGVGDFCGDNPIFPYTLLANAIQIKFRCTKTHQIMLGAKLIETDLPIDCFQIPTQDNNYISLTEALSN